MGLLPLYFFSKGQESQPLHLCRSRCRQTVFRKQQHLSSLLKFQVRSVRTKHFPSQNTCFYFSSLPPYQIICLCYLYPKVLQITHFLVLNAKICPNMINYFFNLRLSNRLPSAFTQEIAVFQCLLIGQHLSSV